MSSKRETFTVYMRLDRTRSPISAIKGWLSDNGRSDHLINIYNNIEHHRLAVVLSDRDTAILLKLSLA